jgi:hypothetical protein
LVDQWIKELYKNTTLNNSSNHDGIDLFVNIRFKKLRLSIAKEETEEVAEIKQVKFKESAPEEEEKK